MLKVKRLVHSKNSTSQIDEWEDDIKNSIKKMYLQNKKGTDLIKQYENAMQKLKQECTFLYKENQELKKTVREMQFKQNASCSNENLRKRPLSRFDYENESDENENVQYIVRKERKTPTKRVIYEAEDESGGENDETDGESRRKVNEKIEEIIEKKKKQSKNQIEKV